MENELEIINRIEVLLYESKNLKELINNPLSKVYYIGKKTHNLKYIYTARLNKKIRLLMRPIGDYPYNLEKIVEIEFEGIDENHYKKG